MTVEPRQSAMEILLVEDNPDDVRLIQAALREGGIRNNLNVAHDGLEAMSFLQRAEPFQSSPRPDLILLDLNLPRIHGHEVLARIKADDDLRTIPVVVMAASTAEEDIVRSYDLHANCYVNKPSTFDQLIRVIRAMERFWLDIATLPRSGNHSSTAR